jgi:hypothetical protein
MNFVKPHVSGFAKEVWRERERERERFLPFARGKLKVKNAFR